MPSDKKINVFLKMCESISELSKDPSTNVGALITDDKNVVVSMGYNGFPRGIEDTREWLQDRELKRKIIIHAEENAIISSKKDLTNCIIYTTHRPCIHCASLIVQSGISKVFYIENYKEYLGKDIQVTYKTDEIFRKSNTHIQQVSIQGENHVI